MLMCADWKCSRGPNNGLRSQCAGNHIDGQGERFVVCIDLYDPQDFEHGNLRTLHRMSQ